MKPTHLAHLLILISIWSCHTSLLLELYKIIHMQWWEPEVSISLVVLKIVTSNTIWSILNLVLKKLGRGKIPTHPPHRRPAPLPSTPPPPPTPPRTAYTGIVLRWSFSDADPETPWRLPSMYHRAPRTHACSHVYLAENKSDGYTYNSGIQLTISVFLFNLGLFKFAPTRVKPWT